MEYGLAFYNLSVRARNFLATRVLRGSFGRFGSKSVISLPVRLVDLRSVSVGSGCFIGPNCWIQGASTGRDITVSIGNRVSITGSLNISGISKVLVEDDVLIAKDVFISDHSHAYKGQRAVRDQGSTEPKSVRIGGGSWLCQGVVVLPGSSIGRGTVVSPYSVVRGEFPDRCILGGNPAKVLKFID